MNAPLKSGKRPIIIPKKSFSTGEFLFEQGDLGAELYIIESGTVSILTKTDSELVEVAQLSEGAILGEMSLLDHLPRSASAKATETTTISSINEATFEKMMSLLPLWLKAIIKIVVSRIRDSNKRIDQPLAKNFDLALAMFISRRFFEERLGPSKAKPPIRFSYFDLRDEFHLFTRISPSSFENSLQHFALYDFIEFYRDDKGNKFVQVQDGELLDIYAEYWISKANNTAFPLFELDSTQQNLMNFLEQHFATSPKTQHSEPKDSFLKNLALFQSKSSLQDFDKLLHLQLLRIEPETIEIHIPSLKRALKTLFHQQTISKANE